MIFRFVVPFLGPSWDRIVALLGCLGRLLDRLGALSGCPGAVSEAFWAVLRRYWGSLERFWSVGKRKRREGQKLSKTVRRSMIFACWGPLGRLLGVCWRLLGPSGGSLMRLGAIVRLLVAFLERLGSLLGLCWPVLGAFRGLWGPPGCV